MKKIDLNGIWQLSGGGYQTSGKIPGSVYSFLLDSKLMDDPFYRDNELKALAIMDSEFTFSRKFYCEKPNCPVILHCDGLDTLCDIYINGTHIAHTENMHRRFEFPVENALKNGENEIEIVIHPVDEFIKAKQAERPLNGPEDCMAGFPYIRKAHCMMGWDWGARLPDGGIWRDIYLLEKNSARITKFDIIQRHENGRVFVNPIVECDKKADISVKVITPSGEELCLSANCEAEIENPKLWWPNGLGLQPLYEFYAEITEQGNIADFAKKRIGLRTLKLIREKDKWGESFCHEVNGVKFFAMGADYIPEDNILSRITPQRSRALLEACRDANFNAIRVWGGGYYPNSFFFDICDELGLVVFLDMMFACCEVNFCGDVTENELIPEMRDNLSRLHHHASLGVICGNNEIETIGFFWKRDGFVDADWVKDYIEFFEGTLREIVSEICPDVPYIPSSPTSSGHFVEPANENFGDSHYWDVWHGNKPFTEYRNHYFRYLSEFGFQSFPGIKTVNAITEPQDRNIFSRVMEMHQRNGAANGKILSYLSETYLYPQNFETLLYASQLLQAESIKYGVEHLRRNRGRCMGALYWQLNDNWPVASWASIDYYGRYKALQYYAKRFYEPVLISCHEVGERTTRPIVNKERTVDYKTTARLCLTNDTRSPVSGRVSWRLCSSSSKILQKGEFEATVEALSVKWLDELDFNKTDVNNNYFYYEFIVNGASVSSGSVTFTAPKYFNFPNPELSARVEGDEIVVTAKSYAKSVEIDSPSCDFVLSDNYFDMNAGEKRVKIISGKPENLSLKSVYDIR